MQGCTWNETLNLWELKDTGLIYWYDDQGRLVKESHSPGHAITYTLSPDGHLTVITQREPNLEKNSQHGFEWRFAYSDLPDEKILKHITMQQQAIILYPQQTISLGQPTQILL